MISSKGAQNLALGASLALATFGFGREAYASDPASGLTEDTNQAEKVEVDTEFNTVNLSADRFSGNLKGCNAPTYDGAIKWESDLFPSIFALWTGTALVSTMIGDLATAGCNEDKRPYGMIGGLVAGSLLPATLLGALYYNHSSIDFETTVQSTINETYQPENFDSSTNENNLALTKQLVSIPESDLPLAAIRAVPFTPGQKIKVHFHLDPNNHIVSWRGEALEQ